MMLFRQILLGALACLALSTLAMQCASADSSAVLAWTPRAEDAAKLDVDYHYGEFTFNPPKDWSQMVTNAVGLPSPRLSLAGPLAANGVRPTLGLMRAQLTGDDDRPSARETLLAGRIDDFKKELTGFAVADPEQATVNGRLFERETFTGQSTLLGKPLDVSGFVYIARVPAIGGSIILIAYGLDAKPAADDTIPLMESSLATMRVSDTPSHVREPFINYDMPLGSSASSSVFGPFTVHIPPGFTVANAPSAGTQGHKAPAPTIYAGPPHADGTSAALIIGTMPVQGVASSTDDLLLRNLAGAQNGLKAAGTDYLATAVEAGTINDIPVDRVYFSYIDANKTIDIGFAYCAYAGGTGLLIMAVEPGSQSPSSLAGAELAALTMNVTNALSPKN